MQNPRTLVVIQVIFGSPLGSQQIFHAGEVDQLVSEIVGQGNAAKVVERLLEEGWIKFSNQKPPSNFHIGRPPKYHYVRTPKGWREYEKLANELRQYGIYLSRS